MNTNKRIELIIISILLVTILPLAIVACNKSNGSQEEVNRSLDIGLLKVLSFDLEGVKSLAIEKRAIAKRIVDTSLAAYADEVEEKNVLIGETEDNEVIEIMLRTKLGEIFKQDELQAQFNKLCVSGNFVFFELIPIGVAPSGEYVYYTDESFDENGELKDESLIVAYKRVEYIPIRESYSGEELLAFEKKSTPSPVIRSFVFSIKNGKIYDLSETGYEVLGKGVVKLDNEIYRVSVNEEGELETIPVFTDFQKQRIFFGTSYDGRELIRVDKYGNIFAESETLSYIEEGVYVTNVAISGRDNLRYEIDKTGQAVQLDLKNKYVKWINENGLRDLLPGDNFYQEKICLYWPYRPFWQYWEGVKDGIPYLYSGLSLPSSDGPSIESYNINGKVFGFSLTPEVSVVFTSVLDGEYYFDYLAEVQGQANYLVWYDSNTKIEFDPGARYNPEVGIIDDIYITTVSGFHLIDTVEDFLVKYPNAKKKNSGFGGDQDAFVVTTSQDETTYELYWDEDEETVKIRAKEEIVAKPKEIKKFQPIG